MTIDLAGARRFVRSHGRLLERRRMDHLLGGAPATGVLSALAAYRNADGGIGALEPDLRTDTSQPSAVMYALEILTELGPVDDGGLASGALDWLQTVTAPDGSVTFVLPTAADAPHAPWWTPQDAPPASLLMTAGIAAVALRVAPAHPWIGPATAWCWERLGTLPATEPYTLRAVVDLLDAVPDRARADAELDVLADRLPDDGVLRVAAGVEGETLRALDIAPHPGHAGRRLFGDALIGRELDALAGAQAHDGGWTFSWPDWNPAGGHEWRGIVTVKALRTLRAYGRLDP
ncbi:hypothetical protein FSW04_05790 [Baekduia soli]|uniref:Uncharacterized protein n=1 Tax=Baekduia soli TaxID=496014 RepID=A0A5B8U2F9_9ACTN|nr:hypothetical protein [Baekduia soli]QEC47148.1 hypothetical protein FSW04_05790 [Baekduia soli]